MFEQSNIPAFFLRIIVFSLVSSSFPILNHFFRTALIKVMSSIVKGPNEEFDISANIFGVVTAIVLLIPLSVTIFYPEIASILSVVGSVCGLFVLYFLPILTYLTKLHHECQNPVFAEANKINQDYLYNKLY